MAEWEVATAGLAPAGYRKITGCTSSSPQAPWCRRRSLRWPSLSVDGASVRPPARFPAGPLKFRTVGFPEYGFKRPLHPESASARPGLKGTRLCPPAPQVGSDLRVTLRGRGPRAATLATTAGTMSRPRVLSSPAVMLSAGSSVLPPDPRDSTPPPDFAGYAYTGGLAFRGCSRRASSPSLLCPDVLDTMPSPLRRKGPSVHSHRFPKGTSLRPRVRGSTPSSFPFVRFHGESFDAAEITSCYGLASC